MKACHFCAEEIQDAAIVCRFCNRGLTDAPAVAVTTTNSPAQTWSPGIAAVLSLVIPGAGQMYRGKVGIGIVWLIAVVAGYMMLVLPGLVLHLACIFAAASGGGTAQPQSSSPAVTVASNRVWVLLLILGILIWIASQSPMFVF